MTYVDRSGLRIADVLAEFIGKEVLPGTGLDERAFWNGAAEIFRRFASRNAELLKIREELQGKIDAWHLARRGELIDQAEYEAFLGDIGYLVEQPKPFAILTQDVDPEIAAIAGPQLVVPVTNARFVLNAANARWGSLYDALYGTDALEGAVPETAGYDAERGNQAILWGRAFLDRSVPLADGSWRDWNGHGDPVLKDASQLIGRADDNVLLRNHGLHIELVIDRDHPVGRHDSAGVADIILEAALSTIVDFEDSVAAVDADDKVAAYANWLGLMKGNLAATFNKNGQSITRSMHDDRSYHTPSGEEIRLKGRSLLLARNVGHLMTTPAVLLPDGSEAPEGILDGIVTSLIGLHDFRGKGAFRNSEAGSIYIVKPKMHGPDECSFANDLFGAIEDLLVLPRYTIKVGLMDEERRTSANLAACIHALQHRLVFINTGFLDRTGDEIHTSMQAGPMVRKGDMKTSLWLRAYEDRNVQIGLACGLSGRAQIGKGMWAAPDRMADMLRDKAAHPKSGASTAWVPSPTAATLHATHYHEVDIFARQAERGAESVAPLNELLSIPLAQNQSWSDEEIREELDNNAQGILGYVSRWIDQGIGCSKVPDIHDVALMEDRATLRISSQHMANWLLHGVCTRDQVDAAFARMAVKVDQQNSSDQEYLQMAGNAASAAFAVAKALVFDGLTQPNGYTEPLLHSGRRAAKCQHPPTGSL